MALVFICTPGNTGSSLLTGVFAGHGFATGGDETHDKARYPFGREEYRRLKTVAKTYIRTHGGAPWELFGGDGLVVGDDFTQEFNEALKSEKLTGDIILKGSYFLWLKEKMPPAQWILAYRNIDRAAASMFERISPDYGLTLKNVHDRIEGYFKAAEGLCDYTIDVDDFVKGDPQALPEIMNACGIEYDSEKAGSMINTKLWRF